MCPSVQANFVVVIKMRKLKLSLNPTNSEKSREI
jgi:hypothetical protein